MTDPVKLTEARSWALCDIETGNAKYYAPMHGRQRERWEVLHSSTQAVKAAVKAGLAGIVRKPGQTGWCDISLTDAGRAALARHRGEKE